MISRLRRAALFLPAEHYKNTWHTHFGSIITSFSQLSPIIKESCTSDCVAESANERFQQGFKIPCHQREQSSLKVKSTLCRTHLMTLQFLETIGKDIEVIFPRQIFQHSHKHAASADFCGNDRKKSSEKAWPKQHPRLLPPEDIENAGGSTLPTDPLPYRILSWPVLHYDVW